MRWVKESVRRLRVFLHVHDRTDGENTRRSRTRERQVFAVRTDGRSDGLSNRWGPFGFDVREGEKSFMLFGFSTLHSLRAE